MLDDYLLSGRSAVWLAHLNGVQGVGGSNPLVPTKLYSPRRGGLSESGHLFREAAAFVFLLHGLPRVSILEGSPDLQEMALNKSPLAPLGLPLL